MALASTDRGRVFVSGFEAARRDRTTPVMGDPSGYLTTGTGTVTFLLVWTRSPCHPLTRWTCPYAGGRTAPTPSVTGRPLLTRSYQRSPPSFVISTGFV